MTFWHPFTYLISRAVYADFDFRVTRAQRTFPMSPNTMRMHSVNIQRSKKVGNVFISEPKITRIDHSEKKKDATDAASDSVFSRRFFD